eukprot:4401886-Pleurochrysis_carterae.AAC.1
MSRAARRARAVSFSSRTPSTLSSSVPSITAACETAAWWKKASAVGHIVATARQGCARRSRSRAAASRAKTRRQGPSRAPPP